MKLKGIFDSLELGLCNFCSLQCEGCPSLALRHKNARELDVLGIIPILKPLALKRIILCGNDGEPLEHSHIKESLQALGQGFPEAQIQVSTNGEKIAQIYTLGELQSLPENILFEVAVDGSVQDVHELTRRGGTLSQTLSSLELLKAAKAKIRVVTTRHAGNEFDLFAIADMISNRFGLKTRFRDTSIVNSRLKPPLKLSRNANVSELYGPAGETGPSYSPDTKRLFINSNGDCYPCVSFVKYKTKHRPVNIYNYSKTSEFLEEFRPFSKQFCDCYQREGDIRQCRINCGVFINNYNYDLREDLEELYD